MSSKDVYTYTQPRKGARMCSDDMRQAADRVAAGETVSSVARTYGVTRQTIYDWVHRVQACPAQPTRTEPAEPPRATAGEPQEQRYGLDPALVEAGVPVLIAEALCVPIDATQQAWRRIGARHPLDDSMTPRASGMIFEAVAAGTPIKIAAARAGIPEGEPEVWASRAQEHEEPYAAYSTALNMCAASALIRLGLRQSEGLSGWQGAARQLAALRPDVYAIRDVNKGVELSSLDGLPTDQLLSIVDAQLARMRGGAQESPVATEVLPLDATGVDEDEQTGT